MKHIICALFALTLTACASQELKHNAVPGRDSSNNGLTVTSEVNDQISDEYNVFIQVNLQNKSGKWIRIDSAELNLANDLNSPYNIIVGRDLTTWIDAKIEEKKIQDQNDSVGILAAIVAGTTMAAVGGKNSSLGTIGAVTAVGGLSYATAKDISRSKDNAQSAIQVPETHLYAPFTVPSMSFVKRWILVNAPGGRIAKNGTLKLKTVEGETFTYTLPLYE
jgi:hypothetical protein